MKELSIIYNEIADVAELLHQKGWAEKNAGNFSVKVEVEVDSVSSSYIPLNSSFPNLANNIFVVTGKGKRMRDVAKMPAQNTVVIIINSDGDGYSILSEDKIIPTSELSAHLEIHSMIAKRGSNERAVVHSHVTELIALTHNPEYCDQQKLNNLLWQMHPETIMFLPQGVGFVPFEMPGSKEIAMATVEVLKNHPVALWEKHGVFSIAPNLNDCYDLLDITAKSAIIYFMCAQAGFAPQGLSSKQLKQLGEIKF